MGVTESLSWLHQEQCVRLSCRRYELYVYPFRCVAFSQIRQLFAVLQDRSVDSMTEIQQLNEMRGLY
jgi:hypothetical protein